MASAGLEIFDSTLQTTHIWLNEIGETLGPDKQRCYHALRAVLHSLRDRLSVEEAAHLAAQLPLLVRGIYYEGYHPAGKPDKTRTQEEFLQRVESELGQIAPMNSRDAARAVFDVLHRHVTAGEMNKVRLTLPQPIRALMPDGGEAGRETG